jgi:hypothetical protein
MSALALRVNKESVAGMIEPDSVIKSAMWVIWPAFLVAAVAELVFFSIFDPFDLHFFGTPLDWSRQGIYTLGFFGFWGLGAASSTLTFFLTQTQRDASTPLSDGQTVR